MRGGVARLSLLYQTQIGTMSRFYDALQRFFSLLNLICAILGAALLFVIAAMVCLEVFTRAMGGASRLWVIEVSEYLLLFIAFLGAPYLLEKNRHVVLDLLYNNLRGRPRQLVQGVNALIGLAVCAVLSYAGLQVVLDQFIEGTREVTVMRPLSWYISAAVPLGMVLMTMQFLDQFVRLFRGKDS